jgi:hypothetical protein
LIIIVLIIICKHPHIKKLVLIVLLIELHQYQIILLKEHTVPHPRYQNKSISRASSNIQSPNIKLTSYINYNDYDNDNDNDNDNGKFNIILNQLKLLNNSISDIIYKLDIINSRILIIENKFIN